MKLLYESDVRDESGLVLFRSRFKAVGRRKGLAVVILEQMELVCNEIVTNQLKHAKGSGMIQLWENEGVRSSLDFFALDYGNGIEDLEHAKKDGTTTTGTMGRGLGAIERLSSQSAIYSLAKDKLAKDQWHGTAVWTRFDIEKHKTRPKLEYGLYLRALHDDFYNGDCIFINETESNISWLHIDGLGHGKEAEEAVLPSRGVLDIDADIEERMNVLSKRLSRGRGGVGTMGDLDISTENLAVTGVGDMSVYIVSNGEKRQLPLTSGVLGHNHRSIEVSNINFPKQALLISASDGIRASWNIKTLPYLWRLHPQMIALVMGQILGRNNDDKSLVVIRKAQ